jgi:hypothetical protein
MRREFFLSLAIIFLALPAIPISHAADFSIGVSPPVVEVGDIEPGEQKIVKFSIFTVSDEPLLVYFSVENSSMRFFDLGYRELMSNFSEEPTSSWLEFPSNPVEIDTQTRVAGRGWKDISVLLKVPENAEPGYHVVHVLPKPSVFGAGGAPAGTSVVAVTSVSILFNVKGDARREGIILDTTAGGASGRSFSLNTAFQNTGTVTLYAQAITSLYKKGALVNEFQSVWQYVLPGSVKVFTAPASADEREYDTVSTVGYTTGRDVKNGSITIPFLETTAKAAEQPKEGWPWYIILAIIILIIAAIILYRWLH